MSLITPRLSGSLLPGVVRASVLTLAQDLGIPVEERLVTVQEWRDGATDGSICETFACGTAAAITPLGGVRSEASEWAIGDGSEGPITSRLRSALFDIHHGRVPDPHGWMHPICKPDQADLAHEPNRTNN